MTGDLARPVITGVQPIGDHAAAQLATVEVGHQPQHRPQQRRFPRTGVTQEQYQFPRLDVQVDPPQCRLVAPGIAVADVGKGHRIHRITPAAAISGAASASRSGDRCRRERIAHGA